MNINFSEEDVKKTGAFVDLMNVLDPDTIKDMGDEAISIIGDATGVDEDIIKETVEAKDSANGAAEEVSMEDENIDKEALSEEYFFSWARENFSKVVRNAVAKNDGNVAVTLFSNLVVFADEDKKTEEQNTISGIDLIPLVDADMLEDEGAIEEVAETIADVTGGEEKVIKAAIEAANFSRKMTELKAAVQFSSIMDETSIAANEDLEKAESTIASLTEERDSLVEAYNSLIAQNGGKPVTQQQGDMTIVEMQKITPDQIPPAAPIGEASPATQAKVNNTTASGISAEATVFPTSAPSVNFSANEEFSNALASIWGDTSALSKTNSVGGF